MLRLRLLLALAACWSYVAAHLVLTYPGWRGDNLVTSGRTKDDQIPIGSRGVNYNNDTGELEYPYGMQWIYPCGGTKVANRTKWPVTGGAIGFQPGWFAGHATAFIYLNMGIGTEPLNYSHPLLPVFQITGPTNQMYPGTFCMPQVPMPANITFNVGDNVTLQVIETAVHGAALYSCVDVTLVEPHEAPEVNRSNCLNSTGGSEGGPMGFNFVYTAVGQTAGAMNLAMSWTALLGTVSAAFFLLM